MIQQTSFPLKLPQHYAQLIHWDNPEDPLRKMVIPNLLEQDIHDYEREDPIGDQVKTKTPGLIHRYPDRALLLISQNCPIHCRFCFRKCLKATTNFDLKQAYSYLKSHAEISEIIFSGGDPLSLTSTKLHSITKLLATISHLKIWRFHSRVPVVDPLAIAPNTIKLLQKLSQQRSIVIVIHINHAQEISPEMIHLVKQWQNKGILCLSQTVLLKGVNDNVQTLKNLFKQLIHLNIKPYYLHHLDLAQGTHHFRVSIEAGKALYQQLRGNLAGWGIPEYVVDLPGGQGKIPVMCLKQTQAQHYSAHNWQQQLVKYIDPIND